MSELKDRIKSAIVIALSSFPPEKRVLRKRHTTEWYFSEEGKKAYAKLSKVRDKTHFFLNYLYTIVPTPESGSYFASNYLFRTALVMAASMVDSQFEFGGYPNILDEAKNPLIPPVKKHGPVWDRYQDDERFIPHYLLDDSLTFCAGDEPTSERYKIERDLIFEVTYVNAHTELPIGYKDVLEQTLAKADKTLLEDDDIV